MMIHYPFPLRITLKICFAILKRKPLSFREDALQAVRSISSQFLILGKEFIPSRGPCLVTVNHYHREGFSAWWIPFAISSAIPIDVHWLITAAWRFEGKFLSKVLEYFSRKIIRIIARVYGFTTTPPMPPDPGEIKEGAASIRKLLKFADTHPQAFIGLAPEGRDSISGELLPPPPGTGRLIGHLANRGYCILPVAIYEEQSHKLLEQCTPHKKMRLPRSLKTLARNDRSIKDGTAPSCLELRFGPAYTIEIPRQASPQERDALIGQKVMGAIADLL